MDSSADLQVWNNAAFDNGEISEDLATSKQSWGSLKSIFGNAKVSFDSVSGKENQGFASDNHIPSFPKWASTTPFKPLNAAGSVEKSKIREIAMMKGFEQNPVSKMDEEIEEMESQKFRLNSRLEALKVEKTSVRAAKFMGQKQSVNKNAEIPKSGQVMMNTPLQSSTRKSCLLKLQEIDEETMKSCSLSPKIEESCCW